MKRIALFLLVVITVCSFAVSASAKAFDGGMVYDGNGNGGGKK